MVRSLTLIATLLVGVFATAPVAEAHPGAHRHHPHARTPAPPAPRVVVRPHAPHHAAVWVPGRWIWTGYAWNWRAGHWQAPRVVVAPRVVFTPPPPHRGHRGQHARGPQAHPRGPDAHRGPPAHDRGRDAHRGHARQDGRHASQGRPSQGPRPDGRRGQGPGPRTK